MIVDRPDQQRLRGDRPGDRRRGRVDRPEGDDRDGHAERVHGAVLRPGRTRGRRPVLHGLVPLQPRPARDVQRAAHGRVQQLRRLERPRVRRRSSTRRSRSTTLPHAPRRPPRPSASRTRSCRGCRSTTRPMSLFLGERITGRRAVDRVPVLPLGGHHWCTLAVPGERPDRRRRSGGRIMTTAPPGGRQARRAAAHAVPRLAARLLLALPGAGRPRRASCCAGASPAPRRSPQVTAQYGLDLPPWQQYLNWLARRPAGRLRPFAAVPAGRHRRHRRAAAR